MLSKQAAISLLCLCCLFIQSCHREDNGLVRNECNQSIPDVYLNQLFTRIEDGVHQPITEAHRNSTDDHACLVLITLNDGSSRGYTTVGQGPDLERAIDHAVSQQSAKPLWIKLDLIQEVMDSDLSLERSLYGLARDENLILLPEELVAYRLIDAQGNIREDRIQTFLETFPHRGNANTPNNWAYRFKTLSYFSDGTTIYKLQRGRRDTHSLTPDDLLQAAHKGGEYLLRALDSHGRFIYNHSAKTGIRKDDYNILRHAGTAYSLFELYGKTGNDKFLDGGRRALDYLSRQLRPCPGLETALCVEEEGEIKLGGNGLAIVAMLEHDKVTGETSWQPTAIKLALWLQHAQQPSGAFRPHKWSYPEGNAFDFISGYYPGEALLGLIRLYEATDARTWLESAESGAHYLIHGRDKGKTLRQLAHDHWLLYALAEIHQANPNPDYVIHAEKITEAILRAQNLSPEFPDWHGSYYRPPRSTPTATRSEAMVSAMKLLGHQPELAKRIFNNLCYGIRFQLNTQFLPESVLYLDMPDWIMGGFHRSLTDYGLRIDYTQHSISSLLGFRDILESNGQSCHLPD